MSSVVNAETKAGRAELAKQIETLESSLVKQLEQDLATEKKRAQATFEDQLQAQFADVDTQLRRLEERKKKGLFGKGKTFRVSDVPGGPTRRVTFSELKRLVASQRGKARQEFLKGLGKGVEEAKKAGESDIFDVLKETVESPEAKAILAGGTAADIAKLERLRFTPGGVIAAAELAAELGPFFTREIPIEEQARIFEQALLIRELGMKEISPITAPFGEAAKFFTGVSEELLKGLERGKEKLIERKIISPELLEKPLFKSIIVPGAKVLTTVVPSALAFVAAVPVGIELTIREPKLAAPIIAIAATSLALSAIEDPLAFATRVVVGRAAIRAISEVFVTPVAAKIITRLRKTKVTPIETAAQFRIAERAGDVTKVAITEEQLVKITSELPGGIGRREFPTLVETTFVGELQKGFVAVVGEKGVIIVPGVGGTTQAITETNIIRFFREAPTTELTIFPTTPVPIGGEVVTTFELDPISGTRVGIPEFAELKIPSEQAFFGAGLAEARVDVITPKVILTEVTKEGVKFTLPRVTEVTERADISTTVIPGEPSLKFLVKRSTNVPPPGTVVPLTFDVEVSGKTVLPQFTITAEGVEATRGFRTVISEVFPEGERVIRGEEFQAFQRVTSPEATIETAKILGQFESGKTFVDLRDTAIRSADSIGASFPQEKGFVVQVEQTLLPTRLSDIEDISRVVGKAPSRELLLSITRNLADFQKAATEAENIFIKIQAEPVITAKDVFLNQFKPEQLVSPEDLSIILKKLEPPPTPPDVSFLTQKVVAIGPEGVEFPTTKLFEEITKATRPPTTPPISPQVVPSAVLDVAKERVIEAGRGQALIAAVKLDVEAIQRTVLQITPAVVALQESFKQLQIQETAQESAQRLKLVQKIEAPTIVTQAVETQLKRVVKQKVIQEQALKQVLETKEVSLVAPVQVPIQPQVTKTGQIQIQTPIQKRVLKLQTPQLIEPQIIMGIPPLSPFAPIPGLPRPPGAKPKRRVRRRVVKRRPVRRVLPRTFFAVASSAVAFRRFVRQQPINIPPQTRRIRRAFVEETRRRGALARFDPSRILVPKRKKRKKKRKGRR